MMSLRFNIQLMTLQISKILVSVNTKLIIEKYNDNGWSVFIPKWQFWNKTASNCLLYILMFHKKNFFIR